MDHLKFMIESYEAEAMAKKHGLKSVLHLLPLIVRSTRKLARPPISGFSVSAVGLSSDGRIFIGVNVEFPGLPLHQTIHAEQFLITNLSRYPGTILTNVVVSAYPCGHCRQFLQEIRGAPDIQIFVLQHDDYNHDHEHEHDQLVKINGLFRPLSDFLPHRFGPDDLLEKDVPLILETHENGLVLVNEFTKGQNGNLVSNGFSISSSVVLAALDAANKSHAPYSGYPSGMALVDDEGNVFKGSYMESAAYNPSLGPAQAAVIAYIAAARDGAEAEDGYGYGRIVGGVLVEKEGAAVKQEETVRLFLKTVLPNCEFHVYHCKDSSSPIKGGLELAN